MSTDLARASTVRELVAAFREAEATVRTTFAAIVEAEKKLNAVFTLGADRDIRIDATHGHYSDRFGDPDDTISRMTRQAWVVIVDRLELRRMMSMARWTELDEQLRTGELPPISDESVAAFVRGAQEKLPEMIGAAVEEVFDWLRPERSEYKTNTELEIGPKVILRGIVEHAWMKPGFRVNHYRQQHLIALENVFSALDGRGNISKTHHSAIETAIGESGVEGRGETELFEFRACRNGNLHIAFRRLDLLDKLNRMAGGMRLRPAPAASNEQARA